MLNSEYIVKFADFGFSTPKNQEKVVGGSMHYMPPETFVCGLLDGEKHDLFAVGIILFILVAGYPPFESAKMKDD